MSDLPDAQKLFLLNLFLGFGVVRNAATRKALEEKGLIRVVGERSDWRCELTPEGKGAALNVLLEIIEFWQKRNQPDPLADFEVPKSADEFDDGIPF